MRERISHVRGAVACAVVLVVGVLAGAGWGSPSASAAARPSAVAHHRSPRTVAPSDPSAPATQSVRAGATVRFVSVARHGAPTPTVQWEVRDDAGHPWAALRSGANGVRGATSDSLSLLDVPTSDNADQFRAVFANAAGTVASAPASLFVTWNDGGTTPTSTVVGDDGTATFTSTDAGASPVATERWEISRDGGDAWTAIDDGALGDGSVASGATTSTLVISQVPLIASGERVRAAFTNAVGTERTPPATLTVAWNDGAIAPLSSSTLSGDTATFVSASTGSAPTPAESWQGSTTYGSTWFALHDGTRADGSVVTGAATGTLTIADVQPDEGGLYVRAEFTNAAGTVTSAAASLTVLYNLGGSGPANETVAAGGDAKFDSTSAGAVPRATERWQVSSDGGATWADVATGHRPDGSVVTSVSGVQLAIDAVQADEDHLEYRAVFANAAGSVASLPATLTVPAEGSDNWSGYVDVDGVFTGVAGTWTVPSVTCPDPNADYFSSQWVGLDGAGSQTVEQDGVEADCLYGTPSYNAWYEMFGDNAVAQGAEVPIDPDAYPVDPGDSITASVAVDDSRWTLVVADTSTLHAGWTFTFTTTFSAQQASAEWVVERPEDCTSSGCALTSLADFGSVTFTNATVQSTTSGPGSISSQNDVALYMTDGYIDLDATTDLDPTGTTFTVTWQRPA